MSKELISLPTRCVFCTSFTPSKDNKIPTLFLKKKSTLSSSNKVPFVVIEKVIFSLYFSTIGTIISSYFNKGSPPKKVTKGVESFE